MSTLVKSSAVLFVLLLVLPLTLGAGTKLCPTPGPVTPESYTWDFPAEVTDALVETERKARTIRESVASLQVMTRFPGLYSPASHLAELATARAQINAMGNELCRLLEVRRVAAPWQQETVKQLKMTLTALANDTEAAIQYLNEGTQVTRLGAPVYREYLAGMYRQADSLCHCVEVTWAQDLLEERR